AAIAPRPALRSRSKAMLHVAPGALVHARYRFEDVRLERLLSIREAIGEALAAPERRGLALSCLDDLCYGSNEASLARYLARPRLTIALSEGEIQGKGYEPLGNSTYAFDPGEEIVLAARTQPGPIMAGTLCRASADDKIRRSAEKLAEALLRASS